MIPKLTIKTCLQNNYYFNFTEEEEKKIQSKHYLQVISFQKLLFISVKKNSIFP